MTFSGPDRSDASSLRALTGQGFDPPEDADPVEWLDSVIRRIFVAGLSVRMAVDLTTDPEILAQLDEISRNLDAIVREAWRANL